MKEQSWKKLGMHLAKCQLRIGFAYAKLWDLSTLTQNVKGQWGFTLGISLILKIPVCFLIPLKTLHPWKSKMT